MDFERHKSIRDKQLLIIIMILPKFNSSKLISETDNYELIQRIGKGKFSDVYEAMDILNNKTVVVKLLKPVRRQKIAREIKILNHLKGAPHIMQLRDICLDETTNTPALVFDQFSNIVLKSILHELKESQIKQVIKQAFQALQYTHERGILHRDIKPANIIVDQQNTKIEIIDWGLSEFYIHNNELNTRVCSRPYRAPELLLDYKKYSCEIDIWSLGCIFAAMIFKVDHMFLAKIVSFLGVKKFEEFLKDYDIKFDISQLEIKKDEPKKLKDLINDDNKKLCSEQALDLLEQIFQYDPKKRILAEEALQHPYFLDVQEQLNGAEKNRDKAKQHRDAWLAKKEEKINAMDDQELLMMLKQKGLPTFGTKGERSDRLKKHFGIAVSQKGSKDKVVNQINKIKQKREERRLENKRLREKKLNKEMKNEAQGKKGDVIFEEMIQKKKYQVHLLGNHITSKQMKLCVCVRKRPIFKHELAGGENDCISVANPELKIFTQKLKVDGITKYIEDNTFQFDNTFNENETTQELFDCSVAPILDEVFNLGCITLFAYGQTGSGKTYTMQGIQTHAVDTIFEIRDNQFPGYKLELSFYEIYGGRCYDLLNNKNKVDILEGANNRVIIQNLTKQPVENSEDLMAYIKFAFNQRTTHSTVSNDVSSRSHAICIIRSKNLEGKVCGKFIVCDLAGSERAQDTQSNQRKRRIEGAEINKSLLGLKECIRAMHSGQGHIPFRASKMTLALRDSFIGKKYKNRVIMIACVCPGSSSADHSVNTLRYADRLKAKKSKQQYNYPQEVKDQVEIKKKDLPFDKPSEDKKLQKGSKNLQRLKSGSQKKNDNKKKKLQLLQHQQTEQDSEDEEQRKDFPKPNRQPPIPIDKDQHRSHLHDDLKYMKETMKEERESYGESKSKQQDNDDFVNFHEKVTDIIDLHDEMLAMHLNIIKEDAQLLTQESKVIQKAQNEMEDYDIDEYVNKTEEIVKKKLYLYKQLSQKIQNFKKALKEEEEISMKLFQCFI